ncbi:hypothetical protein ED733_000488 [Metarhizium rileyi]|uniref:NACHT domain-containing protein n=1 Tax=Metarhizium rileyi (strain RCEF 4871) TaxID=1649241 RepID=A0A5C6FYN3_METRR|nr:hypothetical protein ED733_000488 [Metarhizium rileyi]
MARTRAQLAVQKGRVLSAPKDQGKQPWGIRKEKRSPRIVTARLQQRLSSERTECDQPNPFPINNSISRQVSGTAGKRGTKRRIDVLNQELDSVQKRPRRSPRFSHLENTCDRLSATHGDINNPINPIVFWAREGKWPKEYFKPAMERLLARKKSLSSLSRKRSNSGSSTTPSDQKPREEKSAPYRDQRYKTLLATKGSFMDESDLGITKQSEKNYVALLSTEQTVPNDTLFQDDIFKQTCRSVEDRNEARVMRDITPLIVPPAEILRIRGAKHLDILIESVNEGWNNSIPLTGTRPQPDYSLGFRREAFSDDQLTRLSPFIGDFIGGDQSFFMATYLIYFPFLTCEVKCGAAALDVADRQNAHSMTLAVRAVVELFRAVKREGEVHRQILAFSISHDHRSVRIYGHYPVIEGITTKFYRHPIHEFSFTALDGKEKWTAYRFTKNVYELWLPSQFKRICSAIDQLPSNLDFDDPSLPETGLSQDLQSHHLSQSDTNSGSLPIERDIPNKVEAEKKIGDVLSAVEKGVNEVRSDVKDTKNVVTDLELEQRREKMERWLSPPDPSTNYNNALQQRQEGSGLWFLQTDAFAEWKKRRNSFLWLNGIPGCGKTILSSAIIEHLATATPPVQSLLYFYFDFNDTHKQTLDSMVRSLMSQLHSKGGDMLKELDSLHSSCENGHRQPSRESLCRTFLRMIEQIKVVWIVLDALDECRTRQGPSTEGLLLWIRDLLCSQQRNVHLLVTSRPEQDIKSKVSEFAYEEDIVPIQSDLITGDIRAYVHKRTLDETYSKILHSIPPAHMQNATRILQLLTFSERPLRIKEAVDAIAVDTEGDRYFDPGDRMPDPMEISCFCSSLVVIVPTNVPSQHEDEKHLELQLAHFSVKEYLTSERLGKDISQKFQEIAAKASIATVCLAHLLHLDQDISINTIREAFPLAQYSTRYWMSHAAVAEGKDTKLQSYIEKFFCRHKSSYRNCYSLYRPDDLYLHAEDLRKEPPPALYYASFGGFANVVQYLLNRGANVKGQGGTYGTALYAASYRGHEAVVRLLLEKGADARLWSDYCPQRRTSNPDRRTEYLIITTLLRSNEGTAPSCGTSTRMGQCYHV